jgi:sugar/nucleoside kinase (ribokinase family)
MNIRIQGTGCSLVDYLYNNVDFSSPEFKIFSSKQDGDGGLEPGKLVFTRELEEFSGRKLPEIIRSITGNRPPDATNLGGPGIVSLIHAAQITLGQGIETGFTGIRGNDDTGEILKGFIDRTPVNTSDYRVKEGTTPATTVLSDPDFDNGNGERTFINTIGTAGDLLPEELGDRFFDADIVLFGGTALVPRIHDSLDRLLRQAKSKGTVTVVNTVYDFRNQKKQPAGPWPLGNGEKSLPLIDLLIMDQEEAERISGLPLEEGTEYFIRNGVKTLIITRGAENFIVYSGGSLFKAAEKQEQPISRLVTEELARRRSMNEPLGDTTGCGDNFVGGVIASMALQLQKEKPGRLDLDQACAWGAASGGYACFYTGGTFFESAAGEKRAEIEPFYRDYLGQIST